MNKRYGLHSLLALVAAAALAPQLAHAAVFTINCGAGGPTTALQTQITALGSTPINTINVLGTCVGDIDASRTDRLTISNLSITGSVTANAASTLRFTNLTVTNGAIILFNSRNATFSGVNMRGDITITRGSQASFISLTSNTWTDGTT